MTKFENNSATLINQVLTVQNRTAKNKNWTWVYCTLYETFKVVTYYYNWLNINNKFDRFKAQTERDALSSIPVELLNVVQGFESVETVTITPESILANDPQQWIEDQKSNCNEMKK